MALVFIITSYFRRLAMSFFELGSYLEAALPSENIIWDEGATTE